MTPSTAAPFSKRGTRASNESGPEGFELYTPMTDCRQSTTPALERSSR
jgi:hypothetical protein